jgi:hypothetical protein
LFERPANEVISRATSQRGGFSGSRVEMDILVGRCVFTRLAFEFAKSVIKQTSFANVLKERFY